MARKPMVTRTFQTTKVNVLCMDTSSCEALNKSVTLAGTFKNEDKLMKAVKSVVEVDNIKAVEIVDSEVKDILYGMSEQDFITNAVKLDPETRKEIADETTEE